MSDLVSIIMPSYNTAQYIVETIQSVINQTCLTQTYKNIEIIVVDDNDPKSEYRISTEKMMKKYADDERVIYIQHEINKNGAAARNTGIKYAKGEYISFLDDDDYYYPIAAPHNYFLELLLETGIIGILENTKGIDYLLNILENVFKLKEFNEYSCLIVGEGPDFEKIIQLVQEKKLEKNVFLLGNRNDVKELISDSVVLLSTSRWEGFGMSIIEAFSCGVPVISFDNSGPNEIIDNGKNGEIIKRFDINAFRDAIIGFLSDREKRIRYSTCAFNSTQRFKKENIIKKWNDLLS